MNKEKVISTVVGVVILVFLGLMMNYKAYSTDVVPLASEDLRFHASNSFSFSTVSGQATAVDLGEPVCNHNITYYISGAWLTTPLAPGVEVVVEGSNISSTAGFVPIATYWATVPANTSGTQATNSCYQYVRAGWMSMTNAFAWTSTTIGRVNVHVMSGGN